jgi:hypothetical protein
MIAPRLPQTAIPDNWLSFVVSLPQEHPSGRMTILRTLDSLGCAVLREGVYLLPDNTETRAGLQRLADYVAQVEGSAYVLPIVAQHAAQSRQLQSMFDRSARYQSLIKTIDALSAGFGVADPAALAHVLAKQRRELEQIQLLDFFPSPIAAAAEQALVEMEAKVRALMFPPQRPASAQPVHADQLYFRRTWATRRPLFIDRLASAWLIRRFIDAEATMLWLDKNQVCPAGAISFGFESAAFNNSSTRVTYEELLLHFDLLQHSALPRIGRLIHAIDANDQEMAEAPGVQTLLEGARRRAHSDDQLLAESEKTFDLLYEAYVELPPQL